MLFIGVLLFGACPEPLMKKNLCRKNSVAHNTKRSTNWFMDIDGTKNEGQAMAPPSMGTFR